MLSRHGRYLRGTEVRLRLDGSMCCSAALPLKLSWMRQRVVQSDVINADETLCSGAGSHAGFDDGKRQFWTYTHSRAITRLHDLRLIAILAQPGRASVSSWRISEVICADGRLCGVRIREVLESGWPDHPGGAAGPTHAGTSSTPG